MKASGRSRPNSGATQGGDDAGGTAGGTERQIATTDRKVAELEGLVAQLIEVAIRVEGAAEHFLDKVPGLSAERAEQRAEEIRAAGRDLS